MLFGGEQESIASPSVRSREHPGRELNDGEGTERSLNPPGAYGVSGAKNATVAIDERDVDRELHEEGVNAVTRREDERAVRREAGAAEKPPIARLAFERRFEVAGDDVLVAGVAKNPGRIRCGQDRVQEPQDSVDCRVIL